MAFSFGDSFDLYAAVADAINGYWDSSATAVFALATGRFTGSRALTNSGGSNGLSLLKSSGANDAVHHIVCAFQQTSVLSGSGVGIYLTLSDGATAQCTIVFRSDGAILLTSGAALGTTLATYTGALTATSTWYAFEIEVVVSNTTGSFTVRKNGNTVADFTATGLNTRNSANNYANRLTMGSQTNSIVGLIDDLFWRSDASSVAWMGDIRCFTRMPASDASVQFSRAPTSFTQTIAGSFGTAYGGGNTTAYYIPVTANRTGTVGTVSITLNSAYTGNIKCSVFGNAAGAPATVLGSATVVTNPSSGSCAFTFPTPVAVTSGTQYWIGVINDTTVSNLYQAQGTATGSHGTTTYAAFPVANPTIAGTGDFILLSSWTITPLANYPYVNEAQQDGATSYVYDSTAGDADFYGIGSITSTPATTIAVTTRGYMQKSDAGSRTAAVQLKSGATTVASPTLTLTTSGWQWAWRMDLTDPNTSAAWTAAAVNAAQIGPTVVS
jgi:hypothetical protein